MGVIKLHVLYCTTLELRTFLLQTEICLFIWESLVHYKIENPFNRRRFVKRLGGKLTLQHFKNRSEAATGNYASTRFAFGMKAFFSEWRIDMIIRDFSAKWKRLRMLAPEKTNSGDLGFWNSKFWVKSIINYLSYLAKRRWDIINLCPSWWRTKDRMLDFCFWHLELEQSLKATLFTHT